MNDKNVIETKSRGTFDKNRQTTAIEAPILTKLISHAPFNEV